MSDIIRLHHGPFGHVSLLELTGELVEHVHSTASVSFWLSGSEALLTVRGSPSGHNDQRATLINSLVPHSVKVLGDGKSAQCLSVYLFPDWLSRALPTHLTANCAQLDLLITSELRAELWELVDMLRDDLVEQIELDSAIVTFLCRALKGARVLAEDATLAERRPRDFRIRKAIVLMRENLTSGLDMESVARASGISRPHFFSIFRDELDLTPRTFWNSLRLESALRQMRVSANSLTFVASNLGFNAQCNFTRFFKQHTGVAPSAYRSALEMDAAASRFRRRIAPLGVVSFGEAAGVFAGLSRADRAAMAGTPMMASSLKEAMVSSVT
jgi:AraC family transcriptional regulator